MGSSCCHAESPCGSEEERSVLLKGDLKATAPTDDKVVMGSYDPEGNDGMRITPDDTNIKVEIMAEAVQVKQSPEAGEIETNNTQENGPQQEVIIKTATPSPRRGSELKDNVTIAQDEDVNNPPADGGQADLSQCTLNSPQKQHVTADWEVFTAAPEQKNASAQDKIPDISSQAAEAVCSENHIVTNIAGEHVTSATPNDNQEEVGSTVDNAVDEPSGERSPNNEVLSLPNTQLPVSVSQLSPVSVVSQEIDTESQCCAAAEPAGDILVSNETGSDLIKSHDASESCSGSDPIGLNHSGEEKSSFIRESEALEDASRSSKSDQDAKTDLVWTTTSSEATSFTNTKLDIGEEMILKGQDGDGDAPKAEEIDEMKHEVEIAPTETTGPAGKDAEIQGVTAKEEPAGCSPIGGKVDEIPITEKGNSAEDGLGNSEEDLYRGAGELLGSHENEHAAPHLFETAFLKMEDKFSLAPAMDILSYSEREWKGNTAKSALIRKGYKEMSQRFGSLKRVRGDNYCALRATLFQVLTHSTQLPLWLQAEDISKLPNQLESQEGLISQWTFPGECLYADGDGDATLQLQGYMQLLRNTWQAAVDCSSAVERQQLCKQVFQGKVEELGLLEALKLLMLGRSVELHSHMQAGEDVPLFCWLLFARDSSDCPRSFLSNHLSHVGLSAGLEQVEMFLLGYALQCTIEVYRLYKVDTEEFVTYYPDDHKDDWPSVSLVTEDDRHYNVPVVEAAEQMELDTS